jgi:hypothetical protein
VRRVFAVLAVFALALPAIGAAQVERIAGRVPDSARPALVALIDSARAAGLPVEPLVNKALEGASKGADGRRIVAAVRALAGRLADARAALGGSSSDAELVAGAAALGASVPRSFLAGLRREHPGLVLVQPLAVMADLTARGVPADSAGRFVVALMRAGARDAELVAFRQSVERDIALGAPAGASASVRMTAVARDLTTPAAPTSEGAGARPPQPRKP